MASSLKLKPDETTPEETRCPSCGASLAEGAVICVQCGYDFRSGRRVDEEVAPRTNPLMIAGVALLVAVAAVLVAWRILSSDTTVAPVVVPPPSVVVVAEVVPPCADPGCANPGSGRRGGGINCGGGSREPGVDR
jgi:hypothetical protein